MEMNNMGVPPKEEPEIVTYKIPRIEVYQLTDDELSRIEEGCGQVAQDLTFATTLLSFGGAFLIALLTATFSEKLRTIFIAVVIICGLGFLYTAIRWWQKRKVVPNVIAKIRSRKIEPEVPPDKAVSSP
jgi:hypothetical protein